MLTIDGVLYRLTCRRGSIFNLQKHGASQVYTVTRFGGEWKCTCPASVYRHRCKHVPALEEVGLIFDQEESRE